MSPKNTLFQNFRILGNYATIHVLITLYTYLLQFEISRNIVVDACDPKDSTLEPSVKDFPTL